MNRDEEAYFQSHFYDPLIDGAAQVHSPAKGAPSSARRLDEEKRDVEPNLGVRSYLGLFSKIFPKITQNS